MSVSMTKPYAPTAFTAPRVPDGRCEGEHGYDENGGGLRCGEPSAFLVDGLRLCAADAGMMATILQLTKAPLVSLRKAAPVEEPRERTYTTLVSLRADELQPGMYVRAPGADRFQLVEEVDVQLARVMVAWAEDDVDVFAFRRSARFELHVPTGGCQWVHEVWGPNPGCGEFMSGPEKFQCGAKVVARVAYVHEDGQGRYAGNEHLCLDHAVKASLEVDRDAYSRLVGVQRLVPLSK